MAAFRYPGLAGYQGESHAPLNNFSYITCDYTDSPPPPQPPAEQPAFSSDCDYVTSFLSNFANNPNFGTDDHFDFEPQLPNLDLGPQHTTNWLLGHTTHYGPLGSSEPPLQGWEHNLFSGQLGPHVMGPIPFQADDPEVLAAASTLSRAGPATNYNQMAPRMAPGMTGSSTVPEPGYHYHGHSPGGYMPPAAHSTPRHDAVFPGMLDLSRPAASFPPAPVHHVEAQYGSDISFTQKQFVPRSHQDSLADIDSRQRAVMSCLTRNESAAPSRAPSPPDHYRFMPANGPPNMTLYVQTHSDGTRHRDVDDDADEAPSRKRRKSSVVKQESPAGGVAEADGLIGPSPTIPTAKQQRRRQSSAQAPKPGTASTSKRKRSSTAVPKKNLTEMERRNNHIESEARRRNQVSDAFGSLRTLVPGIELNKGLSRNTVLMAIYDWLVDLTATNERLEALVNGPSPPP